MKPNTCICTLLILFFFILFSVNTSAAIHLPQNDFLFLGDGIYSLVIEQNIKLMSISANEKWFSVEPANKKFETNNSICENFSINHFTYHLNDNSFASVRLINTKYIGNIGQFQANYIFEKLGIFTGMDYKIMDSETRTTFTAGSRFKFLKYATVAASIDYSLDYNKIMGYDLDWEYQQKDIRFWGQDYIQNSVNNEHYIKAGCCLKFNDSVTGGVSYAMIDERVENIEGFTWSEDNLTVNFMMGSELLLNTFHSIGIDYQMTEHLTMGLQFTNYKMYPQAVYGFYLKYFSDIFVISLACTLENNYAFLL